MAVTAGLVCLDVVSRKGSASFLRAGGTAGNVAANLAWMGWTAYPAARLGRDNDAEAIVADLKGQGVETALLERDGTGGTPRIVENLPEKPLPGRPTHTFQQRCRNCGAWFPQFRPFTQPRAQQVLLRVPTCSVFFADRAFPGSALLAETYAAAGAQVIFEPNSPRFDRSAKRIFDVADVVKISGDRVSYRDLPETDAIVIETMGADGLWLHREGRARRFPAPEGAQVVDTAGAGDLLTAAMLNAAQSNKLGLGAGIKAWTEWLTAAQQLAAAKCAFIGARGHMESRSFQEFRLAAERLPLATEPTGPALPKEPVRCVACPG